MALHSAGSNTKRAAELWTPLAEDGWRVVMPAAPYVLNSSDRLWLDLDRGEVDWEAGAGAVAPHVPRQATPLVLGGFAQGGAVALYLALSGIVPSDAVVLAAATHRYREALDAAHNATAQGLRALVVAGENERHVDAVRETAERLQGMDVDVKLDIRPGVGHTVAPGLPDELPGLLADLTATL